MTGTFYPPTTYEPAAGTGQLLCNPPFAMSDHQDLIDTACHNACIAMRYESLRAHREQRSPEACLILAAALETMHLEGVTANDLPLCIDRLKRSAAPRRVG
jgi:hypothetical protein